MSNAARFVVWALLYFFATIIRGVALILTPVAVLLSGYRAPHLRWPFRWMETIDNDLSGDPAWKIVHLHGRDPLSYWARMKWLWRNGANALMYGGFGVDAGYGRVLFIVGNQRVTDAAPAVFGSVRVLDAESGAWYYRTMRRLTKTRGLSIMAGWNLLGPQLGRAKLVGTIRFPRIDR